MVIIYHKNQRVTQIVSNKTADFSLLINTKVVEVLLELAQKFEDQILVWCHENNRDILNIEAIQKLFHHKKFLYSYNNSADNYFNRELGYIEDSPFVNVKKHLRYPTWQASSEVGAVHAIVIQACKHNLKIENNFDYFLNSFAKRAICYGLFCYSEPKLITHLDLPKKPLKTNLFELFKFTKQHYRTRWIFLLFLNLFIYEKKAPILPFLISFFYKKRLFNPDQLNKIPLESTKTIIEKGTIDVLIPTIGRKQYLLDVLHNLATQSHLPINVIIIEQNPIENSVSELDFIQNNKWPFAIKHHFTHQTGACNARNIGLSMIESEFCFMADDDIVFENDLIEKVMHNFKSIGNEIILVSCHVKTQKVVPQVPNQFPIFGGGHAFVKSDCLKDVKFDIGFEFGFGEDIDFGMQLINNGNDIHLVTTEEIIHLKAPIGGFRTKPKLQWSDDKIQPKPSPTVMLYRLKNDSNEQLLNYKTTHFLKNINKDFIFNPIGYLKSFKNKWNASQYWANKLKTK